MLPIFENWLLQNVLKTESRDGAFQSADFDPNWKVHVAAVNVVELIHCKTRPERKTFLRF
jgi:hypothetical protein